MSDSGMLDCATPICRTANGTFQSGGAIAALPSRRVFRGSGESRWAALPDGPIDVSVCIANWNCRDLLRACLESLHDQPQGVRLETIVVDNASTDGAADMVA